MSRLGWTILIAAACCLPAAGQTPPAREGTGEGLQITILVGDGAFNNIKQKAGRNPVVVVTDAGGKAIAGASVTFQAPTLGPSGTFGESSSYSTTTDAGGKAAAAGFRPNGMEGRFAIIVTASASDGSRGRAEISQTNTKAGGMASEVSQGNNKKLLYSVLAGGASVGIAMLARGGGSKGNSTPATAAAPPVSVSVGSVTVGGPR